MLLNQTLNQIYYPYFKIFLSGKLATLPSDEPLCPETPSVAKPRGCNVAEPDVVLPLKLVVGLRRELINVKSSLAQKS